MRFVDRVIAVHRSLDQAGIAHGFGGAIALAYAVDEPRATVDIDLNVSGDPSAPQDVLEGLPKGVTWDEADVKRISADGQVRLWWDDVPVDLFFPQHELHRVVATRYVMVPFDTATIPVLSATDLVVFKALFNRTKDWADIEAVVRAGTADLTEALRWIEQIAGKDSPSYERLVRLVRGGAPSADDMPTPWGSRDF